MLNSPPAVYVLIFFTPLLCSPTLPKLCFLLGKLLWSFSSWLLVLPRARQSRVSTLGVVASCVGVVHIRDATIPVATCSAIANRVGALAEAAAIGGEYGVYHILLFRAVWVDG